MKENLEIYDWKLSTEDLHKIEQIPQGRGNPAEYFVSKEGPFISELTCYSGGARSAAEVGFLYRFCLKNFTVYFYQYEVQNLSSVFFSCEYVVNFAYLIEDFHF
ncbi:hypothetical protein LWI29_017305 [Acer saccharum]|uniref:Uncharacterized protein n=1 Tax=Acer saccharum TaxID=4024 RepID=A0AA39RJH1_ACESA|nr:hypothetical protein LWI29_017305 [Acer saccharum]